LVIYKEDTTVETVGITWDSLREAIKAGKRDEAIEFLERRLSGSKAMHDRLLILMDNILTHFASLAEEEIENAFRRRYYTLLKGILSQNPSVEETLQLFIEDHKNHYSDFSVTEEPDRYVLKLDPCGSGGRLMRTKEGGKLQKAYPWAWGKSDVSRYCSHCCIAFEIIPIELQGYPIAIIECPVKPEDPCINLYYKRPELIPEKYFARVGKTKTIE